MRFVSLRLAVNLFLRPGAPLGMAYRLALRTRRFFGNRRCRTFGGSHGGAAIEHIFVINLDRQPNRWRRMIDELDHVLDSSGQPLSHRTTRVSAVDGCEHHDHPREGLVDSAYTLGEQLFVDPHPLASPDRLDLDERIEMSSQEVAVACSHIDVWKRIASGQHAYAMVVEDDVWFHHRFARVVDQGWAELRAAECNAPFFDILYVSYKEVEYGAEKVQVSPSLFSPFRGLWCLSGYVLSRSGAQKLLQLLPVRGPVDLWMNHQFGELKVYGTVKAVIEQRLDETSTNSYSVLPVLCRVGVLNSETPGLFRARPMLGPVFAFGANRSGLSSLAMALSMLGYRCCSDVDRLPSAEMQRLLRRDPDRIFDAFVNVSSLRDSVEQLAGLYPDSRLILTVASPKIGEDGKPHRGTTDDCLDETDAASVLSSGVIGKWGARALLLPFKAPNKWKLLCEFLHRVPPPSTYHTVMTWGNGFWRNPPMRCPPHSSRATVSCSLMKHLG